MEPIVLAGRYELGPAIGSGGFGTVFRARDHRANVDVAVKLVLPGLGSEPAAQRLRREGLTLRRVASRHVARVLDTGDDDSGVWLVTELVEGTALTSAALGRALLPHEVLRVARGLLEGLAAVHGAGIIHGDVKPPNILVPRGDAALDGPKLLDFGLARIVARSEIAAAIGEAMTQKGTVLGTAHWMAPEVLLGGDPSPRSDVYAAGLVLFELLDAGPLFAAADPRAQLRARVASDPDLRERVPEPLSDVLARMLARDPAARYPDAVVAHEAVVDLDTAPVSVITPESLPASTRNSLPPSARSIAPPASVGPISESRRRPMSLPPLPRLSSLPPDSVVSLRETLRHLDLPMLDALARRERGNPVGRIARAVALALRLELDASALILEPLALQSDVARAIGATLLAPRARRITRARVDSDREDRWVDTIDPELAAMLVALAASIAVPEDAARDLDRAARALARVDALPSSVSVDATRAMLRFAHVAARVRLGELDPAMARELVAPLAEPSIAPLHVIVGALAQAALGGDSAETMRDLERAERVAAETGTTLLDAAAATALGAALARNAPRDGKGSASVDASGDRGHSPVASSRRRELERALRVLERAGTLLANGDSPGLEHEAEHQRALVLVALGRWNDAIVHLRAARESAHAERSGELEIASAAIETMAELAVGDTRAAYESVAVLGDARLASARPRSAGLAWIARALTSLSGDDLEGAEDALTQAETRIRGLDRDVADVYVLVEVLGMLLDAGRGALKDPHTPAARLEQFAEEHGFDGFFWMDLLGAVIGRLPDGLAMQKMTEALRLLRDVLGPESRLARERRTDMPPAQPVWLE